VPWSFRGNGALVVPLGIGPAVLAGAWSAFVLHSRGAVRWRELSLLAFLIGVGLVLGGAVVVVAQAPDASAWLSLAAPAWMILAAVLAAVLPVARQPAPPRRLMHLAAAVVFSVLMVFSFFVAGRWLPPGA